mmetsp:Transcript_59526/g.167703  ORF Transcript_59526/g.167703 Transcript_59526/m.167703 type:complete len:197 (-) Transcript_59526:127-717(-)
MKARREVHVLAFGDSLTHGGSAGATPYPDQLDVMLNVHGAGQVAYRIHNAGVCGDNTAQMVERLPEALGALARAGRRPDFVLMLGGTNDLWQGCPVPEILGNLEEMQAIVAKEGATAVVLAIPPDEAGLTHRLRGVNGALQSKASLGGSGRVLFADTSQVSMRHLSHDGLHFNSAGYHEFARIVYQAMAPVLGQVQ